MFFCEFCKISKNTFPATLLKKETLAQVFFYEFCKISKNTFPTEHLWMTASEMHLANHMTFLLISQSE